jgi:hypothetical protein
MANLYNIESLLIGKSYYSVNRKGLSGIIQDAEKRSDVYFDKADAYLVRVRPVYKGDGIFRNDFYATVAVQVGE